MPVFASDPVFLIRSLKQLKLFPSEVPRICGIITLPGSYMSSFDVSSHDRDLDVRASEERLRVATEAGRIGTYDCNLLTGKTICSETLDQIHGMPAGSLDGSPPIVDVTETGRARRSLPIWPLAIVATRRIALRGSRTLARK